MARPSSSDPIERFRFRLTVIAIDLSVTGIVDTAAGLAMSKLLQAAQSSNDLLRNIGNLGTMLGVISRAGFSEVTIPSVRINEITYRENIDNQRFSKQAGLAKYESISLRRGVTSNRDLYNWYRFVNDDIAMLNVAQELGRNSKITINQNENYRKDVILEVLDRTGTSIKAWYMFNAFPIFYKGGNDLDANGEDKLVEELELTYEFFLELEGGIEGFVQEALQGAAEIGFREILAKNFPKLT